MLSVQVHHLAAVTYIPGFIYCLNGNYFYSQVADETMRASNKLQIVECPPPPVASQQLKAIIREYK